MPRRSDESGFTLIEVLVAFTIAILLLLPLLRGFSNASTGAARTETLSAATLLAEATLDSFGTSEPLSDGRGLDRREGRFHITASVGRYPTALVSDQVTTRLVPYEVVVRVDWTEAARTREVALRSLRLGPPPPQGPGP